MLAGRDLDDVLAWRNGQSISGAQFLGEAQALAARLPAGRPLNLCQDRYHFALGLAAALLRGQTSLLPPNVLPQTLRQLPVGDLPPYALVDDPAPDTTGLPTVSVYRDAAAPALHTAPLIPAALQAVCLLTSGSTGAPQPHTKTWGALVANIGAQSARLAELLQRDSLQGLTLVATVPPQHSYGLESSVLLALLGGATLDAGRPFYPADIAQALQRVPAPRALVSTPFHLKTLLGAGLTLPPAALVLSATAPMSLPLARAAESALQARLIEIYGCTEAGQVASRQTTAGDVWTTLGALRLAVDTPADEAQEPRWWVQGGHVTTPTPLADVLELLDERRFRLLGRSNDLIHVAGKRSSLSHLNHHLQRIDGVLDGAFWLPEDEAADAAADSPGVRRPVAFVVAPGLGAGAIISALRERLEPAFVPRRIIPVAALPREATGKLTASALRDFARQHLGPQPGSAPLDADGSVVQWERVPENHPALAGHFPGHPVLPGAVLLAWVLRAVQGHAGLAARLGAHPQVAQAKFLHPVRPGDRVRLQLTPAGQGVAFVLQVDQTPVARGQLSPGRQP